MVKYLDLRNYLINKIEKKGGWVNCHCHLDRAFSLTFKNFNFGQEHLHKKWLLIDELKRTTTITQIYDRMAYSIEKMIAQKVQAVGSFIDVDEVIKDKAIKAAEKIKVRYGKAIKIKFINQTLKGVIDKKNYDWFLVGADFCDIVGGLPGKDHPYEEKHLEIILTEAKKRKKMVHVHVDQLNSSKEKETELLAKKTIEFKLEGSVVAIHSISLAAHKKSYREKVYKLLKKAKISVVSCPTAWIDSLRSEDKTVSHNSITPVDELVKFGINVGIGTDNIADIYKPFTNGDMWTELRFLLEANRFYNLKKLVDIATNNGLKVLDIKK